MPNQFENIPNIQSSHQQVDDLIGVPPNWLMKSGITVVFLVTSVIFALSAFIKYPDKIVANGIMTSENPPIEHVNLIAGIIEEIFIVNGDFVDEGQALIYIKNNADRNDINELKTFISEYSTIVHIPDYLKLNIPKGLHLGEIQGDFSQLVLQISQFKQTLRQSGVFEQIRTLENEIKENESLRQILITEKNYSKEELALLERDFKRQSELNKSGIISDLDREKIESRWLSSQKQFSNLDQGIIQNKIREEQLILDKQKLIEDRASKIQSHRFDIEKTINTLEFKIDEWEEKYFVTAEVAGEVSFIGQLTKDKYVTQNTNLVSIIPSNNSNAKQIHALVTNNGIGKINIKDKVVVKVNGYPYKEFGTLISEVKSISELPEIVQGSNGEVTYLYITYISLPDRLITSLNNEIEFRPNSAVTAEIITKDKSILERLLETFISLIRE